MSYIIKNRKKIILPATGVNPEPNGLCPTECSLNFPHIFLPQKLVVAPLLNICGDSIEVFQNVYFTR